MRLVFTTTYIVHIASVIVKLLSSNRRLFRLVLHNLFEMPRRSLVF